MPTVTRISIAPVKGLALVHPDEVELERSGVRANRRFHIVDADGRRYNQIRKGELVQIQAEYDPGREWLALAFPDGSHAEGIVERGEETVTDFYGRPVGGHLAVGPWSEALSAWVGRPLRVVQSPPGAAVDRRRGEVSAVSEASLAELARRAGAEEVDGRRFRMLFQLDGFEAHGEDDWLGRRVRIGEALVKLHGRVARCAITTQDPESGIPDLDTLRLLRDYRVLDGDGGLDFGVYGEVLEPGRVRLGDRAEPLELSLLDATA